MWVNILLMERNCAFTVETDLCQRRKCKKQASVWGTLRLWSKTIQWDRSGECARSDFKPAGARNVCLVPWTMSALNASMNTKMPRHLTERPCWGWQESHVGSLFSLEAISKTCWMSACQHLYFYLILSKVCEKQGNAEFLFRIHKMRPKRIKQQDMGQDCYRVYKGAYSTS